MMVESKINLLVSQSTVCAVGAVVWLGDIELISKLDDPCRFFKGPRVMSLCSEPGSICWMEN